jgi:hypothetical protein
MPHPFEAGGLAPLSTGAAAAALSVSIVDKGVSWDVNVPLSEAVDLARVSWDVNVPLSETVDPAKSTLLIDSPPPAITSSVGGEASPDSSELFLTDFFLPIIERIGGGRGQRERRGNPSFYTFRMTLFLTSSVLLNNI